MIIRTLNTIDYNQPTTPLVYFINKRFKKVNPQLGAYQYKIQRQDVISSRKTPQEPHYRITQTLRTQRSNKRLIFVIDNTNRYQTDIKTKEDCN